MRFVRIACVLALCLFALVSESLAQTTIPGGVFSGTVRWTKSMSPITVTRPINLYGVLIIDPGVTVKMAGQVKIYLYNGASSQLLVNGTSTEPVVITALEGSTTGPNWSGIWVPGTRTTRPIVRITNAYISGLGMDTSNFDFKNTDFQISDTLIQSLPVVPSGYPLSGNNVSIMSGLNTAVGSFTRCLFVGQTNGIPVSPTIGVVDCDFENVKYPIFGNRVNITALPY